MGDAACSAADWAAVEELRRQTAARPDDARLHFQLGERLLSLGDGHAAIASFRRAAELAPRVAAAHFGLANACYAAGQFEAAVEAFRAAQALENDAPTANNLGNALAQLGRLDEAAAAFAEALRLKPDFVPALVNAGRTSLGRGDLAAAARSFEQALAFTGERAELRVSLGDVYASLGRTEAAAVEYVRAAVQRPDDAALFHRLGDVNRRRGQLTEAQFCYAKALELEPRSAVTHSALVESMLYDAGTSAAQVLHEAQYWSTCHAAKDAPKPARPTDPDRPLRIGYVTCDAADGPLGAMLAGVLRHHDQALFEPVRYALNDGRLSPYEFVAQVRGDGIDVLVDLVGHRPGNRLQAFALRAAPVQAAWLGYPGTTGLAAMEYLLADRELVPPGEDDLFVERIIRLDDGYFGYTPPTVELDVGPLPAERHGGVTFGVCCELVKIAPPVVQLWSALLQSEPTSSLFIHCPELSDPAVQDRLAAQFAEHFVERNRLRFTGVAERDALLAAYQEIDLALDPFPYDGGVEILDALWMGVPVVHLRGRRFSGRRGDVILRAAGLAEFIADSPEQYLEKAQAWAVDRAGLAALRGRLRSQLVASSLCDVPAFVRGLEAAYRSMWHRECENSC